LDRQILCHSWTGDLLNSLLNCKERLINAKCIGHIFSVDFTRINCMKSLLSLLLLSLLSSLVYAFEASLVTQGSWQQGAVIQGRVAPTTQVLFLDRDVQVTARGLFVIGLGRDAPAQMVINTVDATGKKQAHYFDVLQRDYRIQKVEGVPKKTVNPTPKQVKRSRKEAALTWKARQLNSSREDFLMTFQWPILGPITGVYGSQRYYNGEARRPHYGVDVAAPKGAQVVAPAAGVVTLVHSNMFFSGGTLIVDHGHGLSSTFIHLSKILVAEGEVLQQGQPIAEVGSTGRATGPHLDWRMNWFNQRLDPQLLVGAMPQPMPSDSQ